MSDIKVVTKVERSPKGLAEALFNSLDALNAGTQSAEDARAVSHTARTVVNLARLEMDAEKLSSDLARPLKVTSLPQLGQ